MVGKLDSIWMVEEVLRDQLNAGGVMTDGGWRSARKRAEASSDHQFAPLTIRCVEHTLKESRHIILHSEFL